MKFRPCIDLHSGLVKQIVGSTLTDNREGNNDAGETNFVSSKPGEPPTRLGAKEEENTGEEERVSFL